MPAITHDTTTNIDMTLDAVAEESVVLYYQQRTNMEWADELSERAERLWTRMFAACGNAQANMTRLINSDEWQPSTTEIRRIIDRHLSKPNSDEGFLASNLWLDRVGELRPLVEEWPTFRHGDADPAEQEQIVVWSELIGLSPEVAECYSLIAKTGNRINAITRTAEFPEGETSGAKRRAEEFYGWYVQIGTSRRQTTGWVVGGKGNTIGILPDPLAQIRRLDHYTTRYRASQQDMQAAQAAARFQHSTGLRSMGTEIQKFSLEKSTVWMIFPPDIARERREWANGLIARAAAAHDKGVALAAEWSEWHGLAKEIIQRKYRVDSFMKDLDSSGDLIRTWSAPAYVGMRYMHGGHEAFMYLIEKSGVSEAELREGIKAQFIKKNPECVLSEDDEAMLAKEPVKGKGAVPDVIAALMIEANDSALPTF